MGYKNKMNKISQHVTTTTQQGNRKVKIIDTDYGTELRVTHNGYQWSSCPVTRRTLHMLQEIIVEYLEIKDLNDKADPEKPQIVL